MPHRRGLCHEPIEEAEHRPAPVEYLEIICATPLGYLIFGDFPDALTILGTAIIVGAGLYVFHRERRLARRVHIPAEQP